MKGIESSPSSSSLELIDLSGRLTVGAADCRLEHHDKRQSHSPLPAIACAALGSVFSWEGESSESQSIQSRAQSPSLSFKIEADPPLPDAFPGVTKQEAMVSRPGVCILQSSHLPGLGQEAAPEASLGVAAALVGDTLLLPPGADAPL